MIQTEDNIDFGQINWLQFEELCFDLITLFPFHNVKWRQGGSDSGRDIEATRSVYNQLVSSFDEKWFFECKMHSSGISVRDIDEKLAWARAEAADHFVIITNSYLTRSTNEYLDKIKRRETFKIHSIEGKQLCQLVIQHPVIWRRYFIDRYTRLVRNSYQVWLYHDLLPDEKTLYELCQNIKVDRLNYQELAFLWFVLSNKQSDLKEYVNEEQLELIDPAFILPYLLKHQNSKYPALSEAEVAQYKIYNRLGSVTSRSKNENHFLANAKELLKNGTYVQVCFIREGEKVDVRIALGKRIVAK